MILYLGFVGVFFSSWELSLGFPVSTGEEEVINSAWSDSCQGNTRSTETGTGVFKLTPVFPLLVSDAVSTQRSKFGDANTTTAKGISPDKGAGELVPCEMLF